MSISSPSVEKKKRSLLTTAIILIVAAVAIVGGGLKMFGGIQKIASSSSDPEVELLLEESDAALDEANKQNQLVVPAFQQLLNDFDQLGVEGFRKERSELSGNLITQFTNTAAQFQLAAKKLDAAAMISKNEQLKAFMTLKSKSYGLLDKVCNQNVEMIQVLLDTSLTDAAVITGKVLELAASRDETQKTVVDTTTAADAIANSK